MPARVSRGGEQPTPEDVIRRLRSLLTCGFIERDTFHLGVHVCALAQNEGTRIVAYSMEQASQTCVRVNTRGIYAGPITRKRSAFIQALQQLHFTGFVLNDYRPDALAEVDAASRHFTRSPDTAGGEPWGESTPIYFQLPDIPTRVYEEEMDKLVTEAFARCTFVIEMSME